jgi:adenylate cyclase class 2
MPKEIEIKIKLNDNQTELLTKWVIKNAKFVDQQNMVDYYLDNPKKSIYTQSPLGFTDPLEFWRIREIDDTYYLCNKKRTIDKNGKTVSVEENEAITPDGEDVMQVFEKRGFTKQVIVDKTRDIYQYEDFEIVFDDVKKLGKFVEIELKSDEQNSAVGIKKIYDLLKKIGLTQFIQFDRGYLCMMLNQGYNFGEVKKL